MTKDEAIDSLAKVGLNGLAPLTLRNSVEKGYSFLQTSKIIESHRILQEHRMEHGLFLVMTFFSDEKQVDIIWMNNDLNVYIFLCNYDLVTQNEKVQKYICIVPIRKNSPYTVLFQE